MSYAQLLFPYKRSIKDTEADPEEKESLFGKLKSAFGDTDSAFEDPMGTLEDMSDVIVENKDEITGKFGGIGMSQLLVNGQLSTGDVSSYLVNGYAQTMGKTSLIMGYASTSSLVTSLQNGTVNVVQFMTTFSSVSKAYKEFTEDQANKEDTYAGEIITIDMTDTYKGRFMNEIPQRRVSSGEVLSDYVSSKPGEFVLEGIIENERTYSLDEFIELITDNMKRKVPIDAMVDGNLDSNLLISSFSYIRKSITNTLVVTIGLSKFTVGSVEKRNITISPVGTKKSSAVQDINVDSRDKENYGKITETKDLGLAQEFVPGSTASVVNSDVNPASNANIATGA